MSFKSCVSIEYGPNHNKRSRSGYDSSSVCGPRSSPWLVGQGNLRNTLPLTRSGLADVPVPRWKIVDIDESENSGVDVDKRFASVGYHPNVFMTNLTPVWDIARACPLKDDGCDWDNLNILDYSN